MSAFRIAHQVWDGVIHAAEAEQASLILMGWKGYTTNRDRIMGEVTDKVVNHAPCDLITVKLLGDRPIQRILLPTAGNHHATLAAEYVGILQRAGSAKVTCCYVLRPHDPAVMPDFRQIPSVERDDKSPWMRGA